MSGRLDNGPLSGPALSEIATSSRGETMELRTLFETYYASIWRLLRRLGVSSAQLDDAAQEVFWVAARRLADIEPGREHPFLYGVALRIASNQIRQRSPLPCSDIDQIPDLVDQRPSPEDHLHQRQMRELLDDVLDSMPLELRTVFVLQEIEGLEVRQVAALVQVPVGTASSRLRRAREEFSSIAKRVRAAMRLRGGVL